MWVQKLFDYIVVSDVKLEWQLSSLMYLKQGVYAWFLFYAKNKK